MIRIVQITSSIASALLLAALTSCGGETPVARDLGLAAAKLPAGTSKPSDAQVELGKHLFFDPRLSKTGKMSCATCHHHDKAWTDGKKVSPKHDDSMNKWNTPSMYNVGYLEKLYWDGRSPGLLATVNAAWTGQMGGDPAAVATALGAVKGYQPMFQAAFKSAPTKENIAEAMTAFLVNLQSGNSPYDLYKISGKRDAISSSAKSGESLFNGKAGCNVCHQPPLFTDRAFHNTGIGQKGDSPEPGRGAHDPAPNLKGAFKTPSLRNVAKTAPYFHDGSVATLEEAVRFMAGGGYENPTRDAALMDRKLSDEEIKHLVAFLESLSAPESITPPKLPE